MSGGEKTSAADNARHLARVVRDHFHGRKVPPLDKLKTLFEVIFFASLKKDEARSVRCSVAVLDPDGDGTDTPKLIRLDRWQAIRFEPAIPMSVDTLSRLSQAFPSRSGALAVWFTDGGWMIWAAIDQEHVVRDFREHADDRYYQRAGRFQVEIDDVGCLSVYHDSALLAQQRRDRIVREFQNAVQRGTVAHRLQPYVDDHQSAVAEALKSVPPKDDGEESIGVPIDFIEHLLDRSRADWGAALCRVLLEIRQHGHGGALLLLPRMRTVGLKMGYRLEYRKLASALVERGVSRIFDTAYHVFGTSSGGASRGLLEERDQARRRVGDAVNAETGAVRFVGALSGVDGLVAMAGGLNVVGFGVEITAKTDPPKVLAALNEEGTRTEPLDPKSFGTRHRSMMRYCFAHADSVGFVVSQDGDVRAMVRAQDALFVWPNVTLEGDALGMFQMHCSHCSALAQLVPVYTP